MPSLLEKALERVGALPPDEQDAIASRILASLADEDAWKKLFVEKRDAIRSMARQAIEEHERGETRPLVELF
jgi:acyl-CoA reductase-like NAD-dependent aldehyde dehydrogenase